MLRFFRSFADDLNIHTLFQNLVSDLQNVLYAEITCNGEYHVAQMVEGVVDTIEGFICDFSDTLHGACNIQSDRMVHIKGAQQVEEYAGFRGVIIHTDLLTDDTLFFCYGFRSEVRSADEIQQDLQGLLKAIGTSKEISCFIESGKRIRRCTDLCKASESIAVLLLKHFVLQIVSSTGRDFKVIRLQIGLEAAVHRAILCGEHGI